MAAQASVLNLDLGIAGTNARRSRVLAIILMIAIASVFWVDSRYPALMKRYNAGTHLKASGALTFGAVYSVDRSMPVRVRVWRTTINWLDANRDLSHQGLCRQQFDQGTEDCRKQHQRECQP